MNIYELITIRRAVYCRKYADIALRSQPILVSLWARSLSVSTLVVVSDGERVDVRVALRFSYHQYVTYIALVRQGRGCNSEKETLEQPITKFTLAILVGMRYTYIVYMCYKAPL